MNLVVCDVCIYVCVCIKQDMGLLDEIILEHSEFSEDSSVNTLETSLSHLPSVNCVDVCPLPVVYRLVTDWLPVMFLSPSHTSVVTMIDIPL